jgi:hypothetical protein
MKKITLIAAALLLAIGAFAQNQSGFGIKGGLNMASEMNNDGDSTGSIAGIHLGFFLETQIARMVDFQPEILFSMQGGAEASGNEERMNYINVPLMFKFYTGQGRRFSIDAGPQLGYMFSAKYNGTSVYDSGFLKKFDASIGVGVSYKFDGGFDIGARFLVGVTPIVEGSENTHSVAQLTAAYRF